MSANFSKVVNYDSRKLHKQYVERINMY